MWKVFTNFIYFNYHCYREVHMQQNRLSATADTKPLEGIITRISRHDIEIEMRYPYSGITHSMHLPQLDSADVRKGFAYDTAITEEGKETAEKLLQELYHAATAFETHIDNIRMTYENYLTTLRKLKSSLLNTEAFSEARALLNRELFDGTMDRKKFEKRLNELLKEHNQYLLQEHELQLRLQIAIEHLCGIEYMPLHLIMELIQSFIED